MHYCIRTSLLLFLFYDRTKGAITNKLGISIKGGGPESLSNPFDHVEKEYSYPK